jgi:uncharacterized SAM-dependent methyltransferase
VGVDLKKDRTLLEAAYNDAAGVTARFNLNVLDRINRELGGDAKLESFEHLAYYNPGEGRVEMHLRACQAQTLHVGGHVFHFAPGETIHTENSYKYTVEGFQAMAADAGFAPIRVWTDDDNLFSVHLLEVV